MKIKDVVIYLIVGGFITGLIDRVHVEDCGKHLQYNQILATSVMYPAIITAAIVSKSDGSDYCEDLE